MTDLVTQIKKIKNYDVAFFDIFDTIVVRNVQPEYVKKIWCTFLARQKEININPLDLYKIRAQIEIDLCNNSQANGFDLEFKYNDMVKSLYSIFKEKSLISEKYEDFLKSCIDLEVEIEASAQKPNKHIFDLIKDIKKKNKKVVCISDMYLSSTMIKAIFDRLGILPYIDEVFVSQEKLISKRSGKLYDYVLGKLKVKTDNVIMLGDNEYSDNEVPKSKGIRSFLVKRESHDFYEQFARDAEENKIISSLKDITLEEKENPFTNTVFSLYMFTEKLYNKLVEKGANDVIFFSREGQFLKKLFDDYQETIYNRKIKTHYAIVSRKATYLPSLNELKNEKFSALLNQYSFITISDFVKSLNFTDEDISAVKESMPKVDFDTVIPNFPKSKAFSSIKSNKVFQSIYEKKRKDQNKAFKKYIDSLELVDKSDINVVDIGWKGSIQNNVAKILDKSNVYGYYFGIHTYGVSEFKDREGLIFTNIPEKTANFNLFNENRSLYEILLAADHGSASYYAYDDDSKLYEAKTFWKKEEQDLFKKTILPIQDEMFKYFIKIKELLQNRMYDNSKVEKIFNNAQYKMLFKPNQKQIEFFNNIYHYENFGVFSFTKFAGRHNYKSKLREYYKFFLKHDVYTSDYYWTQLKNHNNNSLLLTKLYALERRMELKKKKVI